MTTICIFTDASISIRPRVEMALEHQIRRAFEDVEFFMQSGAMVYGFEDRDDFCMILWQGWIK